MCDTTGRTIDLVALRRRAPCRFPSRSRCGSAGTRRSSPRPVLRPRIRAGRRGRGHDSRPDARAGILRPVDLDGDRARWSRPSSGCRSSATATCARSPTPPACSRETGCPAIAIGRGALLNPWFFRQLVSWEETGDPGDPPTYDERLTSMATHLRRLCELRGEYGGCVQFRKVANWYCRVLKPGKVVQQALVMIDTFAHFESIVDRLREQGAPPGWQAGAAPSIPTPKGPIAVW